VLIEIAKGYTNPEIAEELGCSPKTVETHVSAVLRKLQLTNRKAVIRWASERGL
jgi:DNA-binding NarL/FixJ family response regulator